ncbi:nuclear transport factor 2 family protein [Jatrophihabitans sp.]|uniref:nuclear transport factor 2 family protein n=1 Tax=Jatrophihabitans sp. TaxID=1932789 RepID=UPI0030C6F951|nr:hypothetical protein [Jatrophihabitans sp.]
MKSLQELSDRLEINDLITDYSYAIDTRSWDELDALFTADAHIDYTAVGGESGDVATIKAWLAKTLELFSSFQHLVATSKVTIDGDTATGRTLCHNPMILSNDGVETVIFVGIWYNDTFVRTEDGWRISSRREVKGYMYGLPSGS